MHFDRFKNENIVLAIHIDYLFIQYMGDGNNQAKNQLKKANTRSRTEIASN